jgi:excisionase family DNA binding protein
MRYSMHCSDADALLSEVHAADLLGLSSRTLQAWRVKNGGPPFIRAGRAIRYRRRDLLAWMDANTVLGSGSPRPKHAPVAS